MQTLRTQTPFTRHLLRRGLLSTTSGKPKPKPLPSARVRFSNHTEVHIVGTRHTAGSIGPVQRMVRSLPPNSAVAFEQCVLQTLVTLRHSEYDGPTPLPPLPLNPETRIAADSNFSLVAEWQEFFAKHIDFGKFQRGMGRFPHMIAGGVEHMAGMQQAQAKGLPIWLLDMPASVLTAKMEEMNAEAAAKSWFGIRPLRQGPYGYLEPTFGVPSFEDSRRLVLNGLVPRYLEPLMVETRDKYMALMLLANLHRAQQAVAEGNDGPSSANDATGTAGEAAKSMPEIVVAFVGAKHVEGIEKQFQLAIDQPLEALQAAVSDMCALKAAAAAATTPTTLPTEKGVASPPAMGATSSSEDVADGEYYYYDEDEGVEGGDADSAWLACAAQVEEGYWKARTSQLIERLKEAGSAAHGAGPRDV